MVTRLPASGLTQTPATPPAPTPREYAFDDFTLDVGRRSLLRGGAAIELPSRAFDVLVYLIEQRHRCVPKDELVASIWHDVIVTDDSLIHAVSVLRRALGDERHHPRCIQTVSRRGYRFVAALQSAAAPAAAEPVAEPAETPARETPASTGRPANAGFRYTRLGWIAGLAGAAGALVTVLALDLELPTADSGPPASVRLYQPAPPDTSIVSGGVLSPDGRFLAFVARDEPQGNTALWLRALQTDELRRLPGTDGASKPFWSPDSRRIGYFANGSLLAIDTDGGSRRDIAPVFAAAGATWGSDDTILFAEWANGLYAVPASGDGDVRAVGFLDRAADDIAFAWPQFFPDGRRFLYQIVSLDSARSGIYVGDLATQRNYKLLATTSSATLAPPNHLLHVQNGMLIAEEFDADSAELTGRAIVVARGVAEISLAAENNVSATANLIAFQHGLSRQNLAWFDRAGAERGALAMPTVLYNARVSPDGSLLLGTGSLTTDPGLWLVRLDREEFSRLDTDAMAPVWSPDGRQVAFASRDGRELLLRSLDRPDSRRALLSDATVKILNDWSPDDSLLVYSRQNEATGLDLWLVEIESGEARPLLATLHSETQARISPDGEWMAYASDASGVLETYVASFPGLEDPQRVSAGGGGQPQWRADQGELYYLALDRSIMAVSVNAEGPKRRLFRPAVAGGPGDARDLYAADATGTRFLIDGAVSENPGQAITVLVNWSAGLPERELAAARIP